MTYNDEIVLYQDILDSKTFACANDDLQQIIIEKYKTVILALLQDKNAKEDSKKQAIEILLNCPYVSAKNKVIFKAKRIAEEPQVKTDTSSSNNLDAIKGIATHPKEDSIKQIKEKLNSFNNIRVNNISPMTIEDVIINNCFLQQFNEHLNQTTTLTNPIMNLLKLVMEMLDIYFNKYSKPDYKWEKDETIAENFKAIASILCWGTVNTVSLLVIKDVTTKELVTGLAFIIDFIINLANYEFIKSRQTKQKERLMVFSKEFFKENYNIEAQELEDYIQAKVYNKIRAFRHFDWNSFETLRKNLEANKEKLNSQLLHALSYVDETSFQSIELSQEAFDELLENVEDETLKEKFYVFQKKIEKEEGLAKSIQIFVELHQQMLLRHKNEIKYIKWSMILSIIFILSFSISTGFFSAYVISPTSNLQNYFLLTGALIGTVIQIVAAILQAYEKYEQTADEKMKQAIGLSLLIDIFSQFIFPGLSIITHLYLLPQLNLELSNTLVLLALLFISRDIINLLKSISLYYEVKLTHQLSESDEKLLVSLRKDYVDKLKESDKNTDETQKIKLKQELQQIKEEFIESYKHVYAQEIVLRKIPASIVSLMATIELFVGITIAEYSPTLIFSEHLIQAIGFNPTLYIAILVYLIAYLVTSIYEEINLTPALKLDINSNQSDEVDASLQPRPA